MRLQTPVASAIVDNVDYDCEEDEACFRSYSSNTGVTLEGFLLIPTSGTYT